MTQRNQPKRMPLSEACILSWADAHFKRTGRWPTAQSGPVHGEPGESWTALDSALARGLRGLPERSSISRLLARHRGNQGCLDRPRWTVQEILRLAVLHHQRTGKWPTRKPGPVLDAPGETWNGIDYALKHGSRGLPGGTTLSYVIQLYRNIMLRAHWEEGLWDGPTRVDSPIELVARMVTHQ
jgi:hypothetical protein